MSAKTILTSLVAADPGNFTWQASLSSALSRIAEQLSARGNAYEAMKTLDADIDIKRKLIDSKP